MASRSSTASSTPSAPTSLSPLYSGGLCEAVTTIVGTPSRSAYACAPGVGTTPRRSTSAPTLARPLAAASFSISPVWRVSRATATRSVSQTVPAARATRSANAGVTSRLATPRVPLEPNTFIGGFWDGHGQMGSERGRRCPRGRVDGGESGVGGRPDFVTRGRTARRRRHTPDSSRPAGPGSPRTLDTRSGRGPPVPLVRTGSKCPCDAPPPPGRPPGPPRRCGPCQHATVLLEPS